MENEGGKTLRELVGMEKEHYLFQQLAVNSMMSKTGKFNVCTMGCRLIKWEVILQVCIGPHSGNGEGKGQTSSC